MEWFGPDCCDVDSFVGTKGDISVNTREFTVTAVD